MRIGLVGCVKQKLPVAALAQDLYISPLLVGRRRYVEKTCDDWFILWVKHGLADRNEVLEPYDITLRCARPVGGPGAKAYREAPLMVWGCGRHGA
jgi:hypothetical protein